MADAIVKGWPQSNGAKTESVLDHTGPASYVQVTTGDPVSGGDVVQAAAFGLKFIEHCDGGFSEDGTLVVEAILSAQDALPRNQVTLRWQVFATGAELGAGQNASARHVRLRAIGY